MPGEMNSFPSHKHKLKSDQAVLVIIDIQDKLAKTMKKEVLDQVCRHLKLLTVLAKGLEIPVIVTEQYPKGLGKTIAPVSRLLKSLHVSRFEKITFSCCETNFL